MCFPPLSLVDHNVGSVQKVFDETLFPPQVTTRKIHASVYFGIQHSGMLDETFGISCGMIEFPEEVAKTKSATKMLLTNDDPIYKEVRNRHFTNVFGYVLCSHFPLIFEVAANEENVQKMSLYRFKPQLPEA